MYDKLNRFEKIVFDLLAVSLVLFYSYAAVVQPAATQYHRGIYVIITYVLVFLLYKSKKKWLRVVDYILIFLSIFSVGYWILYFEAINYRTGAETPFDMFVAMIGVLIGIELARRVVGNVFVIIGALMLIYAVYGNLAPDLFAHAGDTFPAVCTSIFYKSDGVFGIMANVLATYVILFVLFGAFLEKSGAQRFFIDYPLAAVGHRIGGPAKVSVIASGLFGSISGSAIANTVSTGTFTIPMMKKAGFRPHVAGGIEPAASISGMFMPPIMGAGGFIMAELTGVPYSKIMLVAIFPALMYVFSVFVMVHYEAKMHDIRGEKSEHSSNEILKAQWPYILPLVVITIFMLTGYSPAYSAILGLATCVAVSFKTKETRIDLSVFWIAAFLLLGGTILPWALKPVVGASGIAFMEKVFSARLLVLYGLVFSIIMLLYRRSRGADVKTELIRFVEASRSGAENSLKIGATVGVIGIIIGVLT
ncbi:MAG: TRAP transporter fused permease subunit, partial [Deltaproteobacteria bacterium]|nr:TRAP transporter fused permease subunit [Deltaproteobacteria bacterium]